MELIFKHKKDLSVGIEPIPTWYAFHLITDSPIGTFFDRAVLTTDYVFNKKLRREGKAKVKRLTLAYKHGNYFFLTDGEFSYKFKYMKSKESAFLVDYARI